MKKLILCVLLLTFPRQVSYPSVADTPGNAGKIDKLMSQYADCCAFTGTVLVSEHDKVIFKQGYGLANREWNIPNTPDVKFRIGSITKQFTSMLIMQQVAKGTIKLDGHLSDWRSAVPRGYRERSRAPRRRCVKGRQARHRRCLRSTANHVGD